MNFTGSFAELGFFRGYCEGYPCECCLRLGLPELGLIEGLGLICRGWFRAFFSGYYTGWYVRATTITSY